jgi:hypothetical protein
MRIFLVIGFAVLALWRAWIDWQATISQGYAYRLASVDDVLRTSLPQTHQSLTSGLRATGIPWLWDPIAIFVLALPLALLPAVIALLLWITRPRARGRG